MNKHEAVQYFTNATRDCLSRAAVLNPTIAHELAQTDIKFDIRGASILGEARRKGRHTTIRYNAPAAMANPKEFADTVPHEVAHVVCMLLGTDRGHGYAWETACRALGGNTRKSCSAAFPGLVRITRGTRYYRWENAHGGGHWVSKKEHMRLRDNEWARIYYGLDTLTAEKVMSNDEWRAADEIDRKARLALHDAALNAEAALAPVRKILARFKAA